ncbi:MAG: TonB-dependent receptor plug domain-containing protein [Opitutaceae bacterium]|nr:TonB-dependent receptor plug domain-containing protein [Opitutaceae bacterium]
MFTSVPTLGALRSRAIYSVSVLSLFAALTAPAQIKPESPVSENTVELSVFRVSGERDYGYRKQSTVTTSRVALKVVENPQAVEIISGELLQDLALTIPSQAFRYTSSVIVGENESMQAGIYTMRGFQLPMFYNGLAIASVGGVTPTMPLDNIDRIELAKGPVALFYGNTPSNGVANFVTKKPQFRTATDVQLSAGTYDFTKALLDTQGIISKEHGIAYRFISSYQNSAGRVDGQETSLVFADPSFTFRPNDRFEITAELAYTKQQIPLPADVRALLVNPQFWKDLETPSPALLQFMGNRYGMSGAQAINQRWGMAAGNPNGTTQGTNMGAYLNNWSTDIYAMTGYQPYLYTGDHIDWWRYSNRGDKFFIYSPESNQDGDSYFADVTTTFKPLERLAIRYHWLHMQTEQNFIRQLFFPNAGRRADGRIISMNASAGNLYQPDRLGISDAQQIDLAYELIGEKTKHFFTGGFELNRSLAKTYSATFDLTRNSPVVNADGYQLTGASVSIHWDPFGPNPPPDFYRLIASAPRQTSRVETEHRAYYANYRLSAFDNRLNFMGGARRTRLLNTGKESTTYSLGAIYQVASGFHVFASTGTNIIFTSQMSVVGPGVVPADNAKLLDDEKDKGMEVGVKSDWNDGKLSGTVSLYRAERSGIPQLDWVKWVNDPRNSGPNVANTAANPYVNGGLFRTEGLDVDFTWTPSRSLQVLANYGWEFTSKVVRDNSLDPTQPGLFTYRAAHSTRLQKSPEHHANVVAKYNFLAGALKNFSVGGAIRYHSLYDLSDGANVGIYIPAEVLFDAFAIYRTKFGSLPANIQLNLTNLGNTINDVTRSNGFEARLSIGLHF